MTRRAYPLVALSLCALSLAACRCNTDTPGSSVAAPAEPLPAQPQVAFDAPFVPPRVGVPRLPGVRISPRIFQNIDVPDAAVDGG